MAGTFGRRGIVGEAPVAQRGFGAAQAPVQAASARADTGGQRFEYRPKIVPSLLAAGFFTLMAVALTWIAQTNTRGLVLYHLIHFDRDGATVFYWCLVGVFALAACYGAYGVQLAFSAPREVVVGKTGITAPAGAMSSKTVTVRYTAITHVAITQQGKYHFFQIHHQDGKLSIPKSMIADDDTFERMLGAIEQGMLSAARAGV